MPWSRNTMQPEQSAPTKARPYKRVDAATERAIVVDCVAMPSQLAVARKYGVDPATVSRIFNRYKSLTPKAEISKSPTDRIQCLKDDAMDAVQAGLTARKDPYKRGSLALGVLKATDPAWQGETATLTVNQLVAQIPQEWRDRYITTGDAQPDKLEVKREND